eukprot:2965805-Pleurochrysis_carterae.AAC.1
MYVDNSGAVELSKERRSCQRSRHVDRRDLKVREYVAHGSIDESERTTTWPTCSQNRCRQACITNT